MRVVHICTSLNGGAGLCASRIIQATKALGVDVRAIVKEGQEDEAVSVVRQASPWSGNWLFRKTQVLLSKTVQWPKYLYYENKIPKERQKCHQTICFTSPITPYTKLPEHPWIKDADIVHLHWIGDFVDYPSFFRQIDKPIVWTIHDENPGLGGFHYSLWKKEAPASFKRLDDQLMEIKRKAYKQVKKMTLVAISNQMKDFLHSELLCNFPIELIHNGIDREAFCPIHHETAKSVLGIPADSIVFLFSAQNINEERKGLKELIAALEILNIPRTKLVCLGNFKKEPKASYEIRCEGFIPNHNLQSIYYSAADFFMMPSFQEAFAQAPMEAMACGTPVVAFPCSGTDSLINEGNGVVCDNFTCESLAKGIQQALRCCYDRDAIRQDLLKRFSYNIIARQYIQLYNKIQKSTNSFK